ncbi:FTR1 family protein [Sulfuriflexus mobilis]|uniref:FTR1 family protein n=1 Tax=Sulfuriflexus mobilis TaxID=1811807 RepID=UPI000F82BAFA|nr:FTR1 family protein [Sulfuriflexus mobilis]
MKLLIGLVFILLSGLANAVVDTGRFMQLIDYIGVDYPGAVQDGKVVNAAEYEEMQEFAATVMTQAAELAGQVPKADLVSQATQLQSLIARHAEAGEVAQVTSALRHTVLTHFKLSVMPRNVPDLRRAQGLYAESCAACHGETGLGNGQLARGLEPAPTNFLDVARFRERTIYGLYSTISMGVEGTAMQSYTGQLNENDRWALAFYVGKLAVSEAERDRGNTLWSVSKQTSPLAELKTLTTLTPNEASQRYGEDGLALMGYLRSEPGVLFSGKSSPLQFARERLASSVQAYKAGKQDVAYKHALAAYLDGFELIEHSIDNVDHKLKGDVEVAMTAYRELIKRSAGIDKVQAQSEHVLALLQRSAEVLETHTLSTSAAFSGALIILLREGLEALLVIAALAAFLIKTGRRDGMLYLHIGWVGALILGVFTWLASQYLVTFSGASREITEGVAALIAMAVLFWVGLWLHSKTNAKQWQRFIEGSINKALSAGTMWGIAGLSFIAVYREVFETILFYQAMWVQAGTGAKASMVAGMGFAAGALVLLAWLILRYSARLPLRQFFSFTSVFMFVLAIVFAGKGIAALQEAGKLPLDPVSFPRIDILGIYPNVEGLSLQLILLIVALITFFGYRRKPAGVKKD